jgi:hypothetical protein
MITAPSALLVWLSIVPITVTPVSAAEVQAVPFHMNVAVLEAATEAPCIVKPTLPMLLT